MQKLYYGGERGGVHRSSLFVLNQIIPEHEKTSWNFSVKQSDISAFFLHTLKVHKIEIFFYFDFEICIISLLFMCVRHVTGMVRIT